MLNMQSDMGSKGGEKLVQQRNYYMFLMLTVGNMNTNGLLYLMLFKVEKILPGLHCFIFLSGLVELAMIMDRLYGGVCYAGIDTDPELKYPKGAGRVAFSNQQSYIAAISARFVQLQHGEIDKRVRSSSIFYFCSVPSLEMVFHVNVCHYEDCKCYIRFIAYLGLDCAT